MEILRIDGLTFTYPTRDTPAIADVNLRINRGEFVVLCGPSGCGKTTLLRHIKPSIVPHGKKTGVILLEGTPFDELPARDAAVKIGFVSQSAENQIVTDKVWHELAFGLESLGLPSEAIRLRVAEMASFFGIHTWFHKNVEELSGGQKQILVLASIMAMQPDVLVLDEPTAQLDPIAAGELLSTIAGIHRNLGVTVIMTEHRLEEAYPMASRAVVMDGGRVIADGEPRKVGLQLRDKKRGMFLAMPAPMRVWGGVEEFGINGAKDADCPITVQEGAAWLAEKVKATHGCLSTAPTHFIPNSKFRTPNSTALVLRDIWFRYEKNLPDVLKGTSFTAHYGEITAVLGGNGTGKTTALSVAAGIYKPQRGKVIADKKVYMLSQNPQALFIGKTVGEDINEMKGTPEEMLRVISLCKLDRLLDCHPYDLSGGEQQRAALAKLLLAKPEVLLLDEPTKGLDAEYKQIFAGILRELANAGAAIVLVSHDIEFCAEYADRCALFFDGAIIAHSDTRSFFGGNYFYTTNANRMARNVLPHAVTVNDIIRALGGDTR
ncbi:MAG: ATP-binding cassette domain-containing protein [Defluviitaleaceae bacterium]|nr:ATP-binding cassette domain-containing protein [Defluviitaleaceae bacterium]